MLAGCGTGPANVQSTPTIAITATPSAISSVGGSAVLTVTATNATQVTVTGSNGASYTLQPNGGTQTVVPTATTTYTAVATGTAGGTVSATTTVTLPAPPATTVTIVAAPTSIVSGSSSVLTVSAANATQVTVTGTDGSSYTLQPNGGTQTVTPTATTTYTAVATGAGGANVSATTTVTLVAKAVTSIAISPASASITAGATQQFTATATYSDGTTANISSTATWTSANPAIATVNSTGLAAAVAVGSTNITAALGGVTGIAIATVTPASTVPPPTPTLASIAITPAGASITAGATQQFTATATYSDGTTANVTGSVSWSSANPTVATVSSTGLATAVGAGSATLSASLNGVTGTGSLAVVAAPKTVKSIAIAPLNASLTDGATQQFTATATYSDGSSANVTATVSWTSANPSVATISSTGLATGVGTGSTSLSASLTGVTATDPLAVAAAPKTVKSIAVTPLNPSITAGATQQFTATATYSDNSTANITSTATWTSAKPSIATVNAAGLATGVSAGSTTVSAALSGVTGTGTLAVTPKTVKSIAVTPANASIAVGAMQQFTATATYSDNSTADVTSTSTWTAANTSVATITSDGLATGVTPGTTTITAALSGVSGNAPLTVTVAPGTGVNIPTWHADNNRSGLNAAEQSLTPSNVNPATFGKLFSYLVDGYVYGEPLLMSNITINGAAHNVLYAATENDSVYAFDADNYGTGAPLWHVSLLKAGETPGGGAIKPVLGVTSTPVIDPSTNTIYVLSVQNTSGGSTFRLSALDITTGAQKFGGPTTVTASVPGTNASGNGSTVTLTTSCVQRAALLLANGNIYIGVGSCKTGWLLAYNATTLAQAAVFNLSPNLNGEGTYASAGGVWMGSGGPAADSAGNIYVTTGNGPWDGMTAWGDSILKFNANLKLQDYFTPYDYAYMNCNDADLAAGGLLLIPGTTQALAGGKTGKLYMVNTGNLGHEQANDAGATQTLFFESDLVGPYTNTCTDTVGPNAGNTDTGTVNSYEIFGTPAYFNGAVYLGVTPTGTNVPAGVRQFLYSGTLTRSTNTTPSIQENSYGTTPFISANGNANGILWMIDHGAPLQNNKVTPTNATLRAYDINNLTNEIYNSSTNSGDTPGLGIKFTSPIVGNGKVYISTGHDQVNATNPQGELDVYGLK